jgi:hypothetical protein
MGRATKRKPWGIVHACRDAALAAVMAALGGACGNLTSGGFGDLEVLVATDSVPAATLLAPPAALSMVPSRVGSQQQMVDGTLTLGVQVFVLTGSGRTVEVTNGVQELVMPLSGSAPFVLARRELASGAYAAIRTVFVSVVAQVEGGLVVDGVPIRGPVTVDLGSDGRIVVDTPLDLRIEEDLETRIKVDLHTTRWIRLLNNQRRVQSQDFQREVRVRG